MSVQVVLPSVLAETAGGARHLDVEPPGDGTLAGLLDALAEPYPVLVRRLRDETGALRRYVNLYVDGEDVRAIGGLGTPVRDRSEVRVLPSVAGG